VTKRNEAFVQFEIRRDHHRRLFKWLDKNTPGWWLSLRPENNLYQFLLDTEDIEIDDEPEGLVEFLRTKKWKSAGERANPVIGGTPEQCTLMRMFWENSQNYQMPNS